MPAAQNATSRATVAARLDRLPNCRYLRRLVILLSLGGCCEFYDLFFSAYIAPALYRAGIFTPTTRGFLGIDGFASFVASLFAGLFIGALFFSPISDNFGRRSTFSFSLLWYSVCTFIMAFQSTAVTINIWRFIAGVGIGVEIVTIDTYVSELVPHSSRGRAFAFNQAISFLAVPFAALVSWLLVPARIWGLDGWRWVALIGASGAVFVWFIRRELPESPRWLEQQGQFERANQLMDRIEQSVQAETGRPLPLPVTVEGEQNQASGLWSEMWNIRYRKRTIMLTAFHLFETLGYYGFANWVPTLLLAKGIDVTSTLRYTFLIAMAAPVGPVIGLLVADLFERKWQVAWSALLLGIFGLLFAQQTTAAGVIAFGILITLASNWLSFSYHAYQAELYPTRIRARAVGFVYSWSRFSAIASSFAIAYVLRRSGTAGVFALIASGMAVVFIIIGAFGPRTSRLRLEQIAH
jgi:putative MFS transporter